MSQVFDWVFAGLPLVTHERPNSGYWFETYADGFSLGSPEGVRVIRQSLLKDGDDVVTDRWGNRQIQWTVAICGYTAADIAEGERQLAPRIGGPASLVFTPPGSGASSLFDVRASEMAYVGDDLQWLSSIKHQAYQVTAFAAPWAYAETTVEETFTPGSASYTVVDACTANTNWPGTTAVTHLALSAVRMGPLTAAIGSPTIFPGAENEVFGSIESPGVNTTIRFTGTVPAANYMYIDFDADFSGYSGIARTPWLQGQGFPLSSQLQASGYMRYFWRRQAGSLSFDTGGYNMNAGDTASFYVQEFGTSNVLPTGSLFALSMKGSVRVPAQLKISHPTSSQDLGQVLVYADPTMMVYGWQPDDDATWVNAPDGGYWLYIQPTSYSVGDVFALTIAGQTKTTRVDHSSTGSPWFPIGPFFFGGKRSRRLGTITNLSDSLNSQLTKNGVGESGVAARLFRENDDDTCLLHVLTLPNGSTGNILYVDPPTLDQPQPGVFSGDVGSFNSASLLSDLKSWAWPMLIPPVTALWVQAAETTIPVVSVVHRPAFHTFAAEN